MSHPQLASFDPFAAHPFTSGGTPPELSPLQTPVAWGQDMLPTPPRSPSQSPAPSPMDMPEVPIYAPKPTFKIAGQGVFEKSIHGQFNHPTVEPDQVATNVLAPRRIRTKKLKSNRQFAEHQWLCGRQRCPSTMASLRRAGDTNYPKESYRGRTVAQGWEENLMYRASGKFTTIVEAFGPSIILQDDSPYKKGIFKFKVELPTEYPFKAPIVSTDTNYGLKSNKLLRHYIGYFPNEDIPSWCAFIRQPRSIYHLTQSLEGINDEGQICLPLLRDEWKPATSMSTVLSTISDKVNNPSPDDPYEPAIAAVSYLNAISLRRGLT
ncbi:ubiquitin-conjugating enzyme domain-containing protein [Rhizoctonia solani AG-1 IA]|uniref:Ubiquitin-conjugating enzyme domain-containing protein n=1 Tax=Thanatephorus cucumeris (strain AG1-IA) TaxID=983506 RepID=L8X7A0_THACA|nr:ubiquitin-conjugating enzyme domain-containing protein [Rhizoctonia solani AG-1 IA]